MKKLVPIFLFVFGLCYSKSGNDLKNECCLAALTCFISVRINGNYCFFGIWIEVARVALPSLVSSLGQLCMFASPVSPNRSRWWDLLWEFRRSLLQEFFGFLQASMGDIFAQCFWLPEVFACLAAGYGYSWFDFGDGDDEPDVPFYFSSNWP